MAKDRLFVNKDLHRDSYRITWYLAECDDTGGTLGEGDEYTDEDLAKASPEDRPHLVACITAAKTDGVEQDNRGFHWASKAKAATALRAINLAMRTDGGAPWPDWAIKAKAERWTPPKGWKPS